MAKKLWAGLDVGVATTSICVINDAGEILHAAVCPTAVKDIHREIGFIKRRRHARIGMESGCAMSLARGLRSLGYAVDIYEARQLSKFLSVRRNKTDAGDANGIADAGRIGALVSKVHMKSLECQCLSARLSIRRHLVRVRVQIMNLLGRQFEQFGGRIGHWKNPEQLRASVERQIKQIFGKSRPPIVDDFRGLLVRYEELMSYQTELDRELRTMAFEDDVCRRLMSIPGVGPICALTFYALVGEPHRFRRSSDIGPFFGLTPRLVESGMTRRVESISRLGSSVMRGLLVQASIVFMRCGKADHALYAWTRSLEERRGRGKSRVALARKLAMIMIAIWKSGTNYEAKLVSAAA